ncbi:MAG: thioredoxin domain-containing protein [Deltaproteobacteria bacterium]|nr:thioredoxin domain-containing protein [Deltaproteobacteria bacterium]
MKKQRRFLCTMLCALCAIVSSASLTEAKIQVEPSTDIQLEDTPKDIIFSRDGSMAFILGQKSILIYSVPEAKVTDSIPLTKNYSQLALSPDESTLYLTSQDSPQVAVIRFAFINNIEVGKSPVIGNANAPVTVVAFLDYQCPYCAKIYPLLQEVLKKYPNDVKLVIKHFPLSMHKFAEKAARAALAAAMQNKYEKVNELFFTNFSKLNDATIRDYVEDAGADMQKFEKDIESAQVKDIVQQDIEAGKKARVRAVPTIFINGIAPKGRSIEVFSQIVDEELKKKK